MIIAPPHLGTTFQLGPYTIRIALRPDNPAFARYLIFRGEDLVGKQFSRPSQADCEWLEQWGEQYAKPVRGHEWLMSDGGRVPLEERRERQWRKRGRPSKDSARRELQEALET